MRATPTKVIDIKALADKLALLPNEVLLYIDGATDMAIAMIQSKQLQ